MASDQNKNFFDHEAASYDAKHEKTLSQIVSEIQNRLDFIDVDWVNYPDDDDEDENQDQDGVDTEGRKQVRLLDYACGTGVVSRALAPYVTQSIGIDLSEGMVAAYNTRADNQGFSADEMRAYQGNLCVADDPAPSAFADPIFFNFDIAAVGLGFHHFDDPALAAKRLVERLRPGGVLLVLDFLPHEKMHSSHAAAHTVTHHGFSGDAIKKMFEDAGAGQSFNLEEAAVVFNREADGKPGLRRQIFLARGTKI